MDHFKQTESFMDLYDFDYPILSGADEDPLHGNLVQRQFSECAGGSCHIGTNERGNNNYINYRTGSTVIGNQHLRNMPTVGGAAGIYGSSGFGQGGMGGLPHLLIQRPGFGQNNGITYPRTQLNTFNRHPQRGTTTGTVYQYQPGLPKSYYPNTYNPDGSYPYTYNYDAHPEPSQRTHIPSTLKNLDADQSLNIPLAALEEEFFPGTEMPPGMPWAPGILVLAILVMLYYTPEFCLYLR